ncbi:RagB/SusD family nutrient uptake outer membrane protein [Mesonia aestuariivivens]|nr:RagB/SusD family nutrient uptake outer membrane protein [Mesonia aestuariivivens]
MKKYIIFSLIMVGLTVTSCQDYLEVESLSKTSQDVQFGDVSNATSAVVAIYGELIGDNGYGNRLSVILPQGADDFETSGDYNCNDRRGISMYEACSSNPELNNPFKQLYSGIERANLCIKYIPSSPVYQNGSQSDADMMDRLLGEALALRAQFYYELIRNWGDVPFQDKPSSDYENLFLEKTDRDIIYEQIIADLEEAATYVPWRTEANIPPTRLSKGAIKGLRARIALARAGYSLRRDSQQMEQGANPQEYYAIARQECLEIMQNSGNHSLNPDYEDIFRSLHEGRADNTNEIMFEVGAFGGNSKTDSKLGYYNGLRHDRASQWNGGAGVNAIPVYFYEFNRVDLRRDVTINIFQVNAKEMTVVAASNRWTDGKFRKSWTDITGPSQNLAVNWPILRYADVLLMFAEADNEVNNGPTSQAIDALQQVRARAFMGNEDQIEPIPTGKQAFFDAIVQERYLEFGGESIRKYDLIRWNLLNDKFIETRQKLTDFMEGTGQYAGYPEVIYYQEATYDPSLSAQQVVENLDIFFTGNDSSAVFYNATPDPSQVPAGYTQAQWLDGITPEYIDSERKGFMQYFEPNRKELLPIYDDIINTNYNLTQDYGY